MRSGCGGYTHDAGRSHGTLPRRLPCPPPRHDLQRAMLRCVGSRREETRKHSRVCRIGPKEPRRATKVLSRCSGALVPCPVGPDDVQRATLRSVTRVDERKQRSVRHRPRRAKASQQGPRSSSSRDSFAGRRCRTAVEVPQQGNRQLSPRVDGLRVGSVRDPLKKFRQTPKGFSDNMFLHRRLAELRTAMSKIPTSPRNMAKEAPSSHQHTGPSQKQRERGHDDI